MDDIFNHGVIIGRFNPPHCGHRFLIDVAQRCSRAVTLFLCSLPTERIPGELRLQWLREMFPSLTVIHITIADNTAVYGNPGAVEIWASTIRSRLTKPADVLFASERYGAELAEKMGAVFFPVDINRQFVAVSGQLIRKAPFRYWRYIPDVARAYFVLPIVVKAPALEIEMRYARAIARRMRGTVFSPINLPTASSELLRRYLISQMSVSHRVIALCSKHVGDALTVLPQTYCAPLYIRVHSAHRFLSRVTFTDRTGNREKERVLVVYFVLNFLKRICRQYLHSSSI